MFKLKKKRKNIDNIVEIEGYAPHSGTTPREYDMPTCLVKLELSLDERIDHFLYTAKPDEYNGAFLDRIIDAVEAEAFADLLSQKAFHEKAVIMLMKGQFDGDLIRCINNLDFCQSEMARLENELKELETTYKKCNEPIPIRHDHYEMEEKS